nr:class II histocompatibility antigen, B-L beta chain-like [Nerophis lumbriciformis]XP_061812066.1 class II histocompatibility antigen, B-L beta chain-like [Nerophis lumbriciformis]
MVSLNEVLGYAQLSYLLTQCQGTSTDGHDAVLLYKIYYNRMLYLEYNSTLGKAIGHTKVAKEFAQILNMGSYRKEKERALQSCKKYLRQFVETFDKKVEPKVRLRLDESKAAGEHPSSLICSMYNFYPKDILVTWLRNGKVLTSEVTSTDSLPNGNWLYQKHSHLFYTPKYGETISCMVEHASLQEPRIYDWEPMSQSVRNQIAFGIVGLIVGLVSFSAGLIYYIKNVTGQERASTSGDREDAGDAQSHLHQEY